MDSNSDSSSEEFSYGSDDEEIIRAYENKELKPGLYKLKAEEKKRVFKNDEEGMKKKLKQFELKKEWLERLDLTNKLAALAPELFLQENKEKETGVAHDDFKRELLFYRQAQATVLEGITRLHQLGIKTKRPEDYFAQMAKTDDHMKKVRETLLNKEAALERQEKARRLRELKKHGKQVQREIMLKRQKEKKELMETIKKHKKKRDTENNAFDNANSKKPLSKSQQANLDRRKRKDKKYGYGGQKRRSKFNTAESSADMSDLYGKKKRAGKNKNAKGGKNFRPGKNRRMKMKNRKKR